MGTRIQETDPAVLTARVIGTAPIDSITIVKNGEEVWSRDFLTVRDGGGSSLELIFSSESEPLVRDNPRGYRMWQGVIDVAGAKVVGVSTPGFENRAYQSASLDPDLPGRVRFNTGTRGQKRSIILELDGAGLDTRVTVTVHESREMSSNSFFRRGIRIPGSVTTFRLTEMTDGSITKEVPVDEYRDSVTLRYLDPDGAVEREIVYRDLEDPREGDSYYLRVEQLDREVAWSSPWWIGGFPTR